MALYESYRLALYALSANFGALGLGPIFYFVLFFFVFFFFCSKIYLVCFDSHICFRFCLNLTRLIIQQKNLSLKIILPHTITFF